MIKSKVVLTLVKNLVCADWNYKKKGSEIEIEKLARSIEKDGSPGVLAVRTVQDDKGRKVFEVLDGNHRLEAVRLLGWEKVNCEHFGEISKKDAVLLMRRRNQSWFEEDLDKYAKLIRDDVLPETQAKDIEDIMSPLSVESYDIEGFLSGVTTKKKKSSPARKKKFTLSASFECEADRDNATEMILNKFISVTTRKR